MTEISEYFEAARTELRGKYQQNDLTQTTDQKIDSTEHELRFLHNKYETILRFRVGHLDTAKVFCRIPIRPDYYAFSIQPNKAWKQLFLRRKPLEVECENPHIVQEIEDSDHFQELSKITKKTNFEPTFIGDNRAHGFEISCEFHLKFNQQGVVVLPLSLFYQKLIKIFSHEQK